jgi:hypothetical protein
MAVPEGGWRLAGLGRSASYAAAERGELPTLRIGRKVVVPTSSIWGLLGLNPDGAGDETPPASGAPVTELAGRRGRSRDAG